MSKSLGIGKILFSVSTVLERDYDAFWPIAKNNEQKCKKHLTNMNHPISIKVEGMDKANEIIIRHKSKGGVICGRPK